MMTPTRTRVTARMPQWIIVCAWASFFVALPTALWRILPAIGVPLGTPEAWRAFQDFPGSGTWYALGLSALQLAAAGCCLLLSLNIQRVLPPRTPPRVARTAPIIGGIAGLVGAAILAYLVVASIINWPLVDPFGGQPYDGWAWLCAACYLTAVPWPVLTAAASVGYLARRGRAEATDDTMGRRRPGTTGRRMPVRHYGPDPQL